MDAFFSLVRKKLQYYLVIRKEERTRNTVGGMYKMGRPTTKKQLRKYKIRWKQVISNSTQTQDQSKPRN